MGLLLFDGVNALDAAGPAEAFAATRSQDGEPLYDMIAWSLNGAEVTSESGLGLRGAVLPKQPPKLDLLIVPGGAGLRRPHTLERAAGWLALHHGRFARIASVCTGAYGVAQAGLFNGKRVATHWRFAADLARRFPALTVDPDVLYIADGKYCSSAGIAAGIDLALAIIERDHGPRAAINVARELVVYLRRVGGQAQFSEPLKLQASASGRLRDVCTFAAANLGKDLSIETLAARAGLSARQFSRLFREEFGLSPARYILQLRLDGARTSLTDTRAGLEQVAAAHGFGSADTFRRAFEKRFALSPSEYRRRFDASPVRVKRK
ncbi:MAG: GlxA family transcriptional regulator [Hyphomonadaceae bacterium]|nr:GlxA family transcriptional regulator [Hyphomonadaceae bacterium]